MRLLSSITQGRFCLVICKGPTLANEQSKSGNANLNSDLRLNLNFFFNPQTHSMSKSGHRPLRFDQAKQAVLNWHKEEWLQGVDAAKHVSFSNTVAYRGLVPIEQGRSAGVNAILWKRPVCFIGEGKVRLPGFKAYYY